MEIAGMDNEGQVEAKVKQPSRHPRKEDIIGKSKEFVDDFLAQLEDKELYHFLGAEKPSTFLLEGKPGTGKTLAMNAINNEANKDFWNKMKLMGEATVDDLELMTFHYDIGQYGTAYINRGSRKIQSFFDQVFTYSQYKDTLVCIDEADALLQSRKGRLHGEDRKNLETLMKNLQVAHDEPNMNIILSSNHPEGCDQASLRSGRIDQKVEFKLPNYEERLHSFNFEVNRYNQRADYTVLRGIHPEELAEASEGFNYADINTAVNRAVVSRIEDLRDEEAIIGLPYCSHKRVKHQVNQIKEENYKLERVGFK